MWLLDWLKSLWSAAIKAFKVFIAAALPMAKQIIIGQLKDIASQAVIELQNSDLTNAEKREEAFNRIKSYAVDKGIEVKDSLINTIIELALQQLKGI